MPERKSLWGILFPKKKETKLQQSNVNNTPGEEEISAAQDRANQEIKTILLNVVPRYPHLPETIHVMVRDNQSNLIFGAYVQLERIGNSRAVIFHDLQHGMLKEGISVAEKIDRMMEDYPEMPLLCNEVITQELQRDPKTLTWVEKDCYYLLGREAGVIEVFTPVPFTNIPSDQVPPPFTGGQIFKP